MLTQISCLSPIALVLVLTGPFGSKFIDATEEPRGTNNNNSSHNNNNKEAPEMPEKFGVQHPLFSNGVCQWPGCEGHFNDLVSLVMFFSD